MAHKIENLRLKNSNGEQRAYTTIIFMDATEFEATKSKVTVKSENGPAFGQYNAILNELFDEYIGDGDFASYAKPIITGLTSNADILTVSNNMAFAFASAMPQMFEPFGPFKAGNVDNEFILNGHRYAFFGGSGTNEGGAYTLASSFYRYTNPVPDTTSVAILANTGTIVQQQQNSNIFAYFLFCKVSDLDNPWTTITDYGVIKCGLYYGGSSSGAYSSKYLFVNNIYPATGNVEGKAAFIADLNGTSPDDHFKPGEGEDPNEPGGISGTGGGVDGTFDDQSDPIAIPNLPALSAVDTGFVTIYNPSIQELKALSSYMWSANPTTIEFWKKLVADPMDLIIGLNIVPCPVQDGGSQNVKVGFIDTGVTMTKAASQYQEVNCGSITIEKYWDNVMDHGPFTKCKIYLPYIGVQDLDIDEIMGKTIQVVYHIDILSCACTCMIKCGDAVLYTFNGQCGQNIPVSSANYSQMVSGMLQIAGAAAAIGLTGGAAAPAAAAGITSGASNIASGQNAEISDAGMATAPGGGMVAKSSGGGGNAVHGTMQSVGNVMALKPTFAHSGAIAGTGGQLCVQYPYLILERPRQSLPQNFASYRGYPSNITAKLSDLTGYTEVDSIHLDGIPATAAEIQEIDKLLKSGVIL